MVDFPGVLPMEVRASQADQARAYVIYGANLSRMQAEVQRLMQSHLEFVKFLEVRERGTLA